MKTKLKAPDGTESRVEISRDDARLFIAVHGVQIEFDANKNGCTVQINRLNQTLGELELITPYPTEIHVLAKGPRSLPHGDGCGCHYCT